MSTQAIKDNVKACMFDQYGTVSFANYPLAPLRDPPIGASTKQSGPAAAAATGERERGGR